MSDQLVIHTMKDDIAESNFVPRTNAVPTHVEEEKPVEIKKPEVPKKTEESTDKNAPSLPLPPKTPKKNQIVPKEISTPKQKERSVVATVAYVVAFLLVVGGGIYGYFWWSGSNVQEIASDQPLSFSQIVPKEVLAVVEYNLASDNERAAIEQMWSASSEQLTTGNPTALIRIPDVTHLAYVLMPQSQDPYLVIKESAGIEEYVSQQSDLQLFKEGGWYVLHGSNIAMYQESLKVGSLTEDTPLVASPADSNYVVRYGMSPAFVTQEFNSLAASAIGPSRIDGLVFTMGQPEIDGALRLVAQLPEALGDQGVAIETNAVTSLIPSDSTFAHVGLNFYEEISTLENQGPSVDPVVIGEPAVRQFMSAFTTPYAIFERLGSDGIRDIGLAIALPESLKGSLKVGEPIIEQSLTALIPLVVGKQLGLQVAFVDGVYSAVPLRYVNINGQQQTLDYTVGDNFLLISSSKEGMYNLIDTSLANKSGLALEEPLKLLGEKALEMTQNKQFVLGTLKNSSLSKLLPLSSTSTDIPVVISSEKTPTGTTMEALLLPL